MNKHFTFQEYLEKFTSIQDSYDYYFELQKEIDKLENIIKEIREYIMSNLITEWDIENDGYVSGSDLPANAITPILEILDKENK